MIWLEGTGRPSFVYLCRQNFHSGNTTLCVCVSERDPRADREILCERVTGGGGREAPRGEPSPENQLLSLLVRPEFTLPGGGGASSTSSGRLYRWLNFGRGCSLSLCLSAQTSNALSPSMHLCEVASWSLLVSLTRTVVPEHQQCPRC